MKNKTSREIFVFTNSKNEIYSLDNSNVNKINYFLLLILLKEELPDKLKKSFKSFNSIKNPYVFSYYYSVIKVKILIYIKINIFKFKRKTQFFSKY